MTGAMLFGAAAVLCAVAVLIALLSERRPEGGYVAWVREAFAAWRADELKAGRLPEPRAQEAGLDDLFSIGVPDHRPAYARPEELVAQWHEVRDRARHHTKH